MPKGSFQFYYELSLLTWWMKISISLLSIITTQHYWQLPISSFTVAIQNRHKKLRCLNTESWHWQCHVNSHVGEDWRAGIIGNFYPAILFLPQDSPSSSQLRRVLQLLTGPTAHISFLLTLKRQCSFRSYSIFSIRFPLSTRTGKKKKRENRKWSAV